MELGLKEKVVIVAGGNKGIGEGIAKGFAKEGSLVAVWGRNAADNKKVVTDITDAGGKAIGMECDISDEKSVDAALKATLEAYNGRVDVLVVAAGVMLHGDETQVPPEPVELFKKVVNINLIGHYICAHAVFPIMKKQKKGRIILVSSNIHDRISVSRVPSYTSSKSGSVGLMRHLAMEGGAWGITVNALCPGATLTAMLAEMTTPESRLERAKFIPMGKLAQPEDHANLAMFLASDCAGHITGQAIDCDGGQMLPWKNRDDYFCKVEDRDYAIKL